MDRFVNLTLKWECPIFSALLYVLWVQARNAQLHETAKRRPAAQPKSFALKAFIFAHNMSMCAFSLFVFYFTAPIVYRHFVKQSFYDFLIDRDGVMTREIWIWIWAFYVSKYYEVIDTLILFMSEKPSSFLQMYHHAGAIICCWLLTRANTHASWVFVVLNSFIHTVMYFYYALTVLGVRPPFKQLITQLQIAQFLLGNVMGFFFVKNSEAYSKDLVTKRFQVAAFFGNFGYVLVLIILFLRFQRETYGRKTAPEQRETKPQRRAALRPAQIKIKPPAVPQKILPGMNIKSD